MSAAHEEDLGALPHDELAERATLGGILVAKPEDRAFEGVVDVVDARDFYAEKHRLVFCAIARLHAGETPADLVTLVSELRRADELERAGGPAYVANLIDGIARSGNVRHYAKIVRAKSDRRKLIEETRRLQHIAWNGSTDESLARAIDESRQVFDSVRLGRATTAAVVAPLDLATIDAEQPDHAVPDLLPVHGTGMLYGPTNVGKTYVLLGLMTEMLAAKVGSVYERPPALFGAPHLQIRRPWRRAVWVAGEESGGALRARWDRVLAGMKIDRKSVV